MARTAVPPGTVVVVLEVGHRDGYGCNLKVGQSFTVSEDHSQPHDWQGYTWLQEAPNAHWQEGKHGWCRFRVLTPAVVATPLLTREALLIELGGHIAPLGPRGLVVLNELASRLAKGAREHGDFENLDRDWPREALEEDLDGAIYRVVGGMRKAGKL
jgi:hypothetical protein